MQQKLTKFYCLRSQEHRRIGNTELLGHGRIKMSLLILKMI